MCVCVFVRRPLRFIFWVSTQLSPYKLSCFHTSTRRTSRFFLPDRRVSLLLIRFLVLLILLCVFLFTFKIVEHSKSEYAIFIAIFAQQWLLDILKIDSNEQIAGEYTGEMAKKTTQYISIDWAERVSWADDGGGAERPVYYGQTIIIKIFGSASAAIGRLTNCLDERKWTPFSYLPYG